MEISPFHLHELSHQVEPLDFRQTVRKTIEQYEDCPSFPKLEDYDILETDLFNYLFDRQAIIDAQGSQRSRYITLGFCILIPIGILSAIPDKDIPLQDWAIVVAVAIGLVLYTLYIGAAKLICAIRLRKLDKENVQCASYVEAVQQFKPTKFYKN